MGSVDILEFSQQGPVGAPHLGVPWLKEPLWLRQGGKAA